MNKLIRYSQAKEYLDFGRSDNVHLVDNYPKAKIIVDSIYSNRLYIWVTTIPLLIVTELKVIDVEPNPDCNSSNDEF